MNSNDDGYYEKIFKKFKHQFDQIEAITDYNNTNFKKGIELKPSIEFGSWDKGKETNDKQKQMRNPQYQQNQKMDINKPQRQQRRPSNSSDSSINLSRFNQIKKKLAKLKLSKRKAAPEIKSTTRL